MKPKIYNRPDSRPFPKSRKEPIPEYYQINNRDKIIPVFMYLGPTLEEYEESITNKKEPEYRKIKVKNVPVVDINATLIK